MDSKIFILACMACIQVVVAQQPTVLPNPLGSLPIPPFFGSFNTNWVRPYYSAVAEGWRTYFEQLQQARNQLYQTQNATGAARDTVNQIFSTMRPKHIDDKTQILGVLQPPAIQVPALHDNHQGALAVQTPVRPTLPQVQSDVQQTRSQAHVGTTHTVIQGQTASRPQSGNLQTVSAGARPFATSINSGAVPQLGSSTIPQVGSQIVPQVGSQIPWVGK